RFFDPPALDQTAVLEAQEGGVQRRQREREPSARPRLDQLSEFVAVPRPRFQQRQNQHLAAALFQFRTEQNAALYVATLSIDESGAEMVVRGLGGVRVGRWRAYRAPPRVNVMI